MKKERINEIWGVIYLLLGLFTLASLIFFHSEDLSFFTSHPAQPVQNYTGVTGAYLAFGLFVTFGVSSFLIPVLFLLWSGCYFTQKVPERKFFKFSGLLVSLFSMATLVAISVHPDLRLLRGGALGYLAGSHLLKYFGQVGSYIVAGSCFLLSLLLATDFLLYPIIKSVVESVSEFFGNVSETLEEWREEVAHSVERWRASREEEHEDEKHAKKLKSKKKKEQVVEKEAKELPIDGTPIKVKRYDPSVVEAADKLKAEEVGDVEEKPKVPKKPKLTYKPEQRQKERESVAPAASTGSSPKESKYEGVVGVNTQRDKAYELPPLSLLKRPGAPSKQSDDLQSNSKILEQTLAQFGIAVKVTEVEQGPVITRYELMPAPGIKVNSIASLADDIALALKAKSVRFIIPIPGKSAVGVEVPNSVSNVVSFREMIDTQAFRAKSAKIPLVLGKTANGQPLIGDLAKMPHILIAGSTGSGKTVCMNSIITGMLYQYSPEELKFVMVDPKMVELSNFNNIPHMLAPVVTDARKAAQTLGWVVNEMENRYRLFATCAVRNIDAFNSRPVSEEAAKQMEENEDSENVVPHKLPYIVLVIDELADLMLVARDKVEGQILRLAQLARAAGIHMILATQRPSVNVITGVIKANFPARISFKVSSKVDSRTVLDASGAETLIGRGDMLFLQSGDPKPVRGQAPLITDQEINDVVAHVSKQEKPQFREDIQQVQEGRSGGGAEKKDELFDEAVQIVLETKQASTSNLQRRMRLGYTRAARIIDQMEAEGIIGPAQGSKPREILVSPEEVEVGQD